MIQFSIKLKNGHGFTKTYNYDRCHEEYPGAYIELV